MISGSIYSHRKLRSAASQCYTVDMSHDTVDLLDLSVFFAFGLLRDLDSSCKILYEQEITSKAQRRK